MALETEAARALVIPIVYGNISFSLGKRSAPGESTHKWCVYVRSPSDHDLSYAIERVAFKIHDTFPNPLREFTSPPYVVSESGWGEFEVGIRIYLRDKSFAPINITHRLKLYSTAPTGVDKPSVVDELYDEIVLNERGTDPEFYNAVARGAVARQPPYPYAEWFLSFTAKDDLPRLMAARAWLFDRKKEMEERLLLAQRELEREKQEVQTLSGGVTAATLHQ